MYVFEGTYVSVELGLGEYVYFDCDGLMIKRNACEHRGN